MRSIAIKHKIILAFTAIGILVLTSSVFFYWSLNKISVNNTRTEKLAVPVQQFSKDLRLSLLSITKFNALAYSQANLDLLQQNKKQAQVEQQQFSDMLNLLSTQLNQQITMQNLLTSTNTGFEQLTEVSVAMFSAKERKFVAQNSTIELSATFNEQLYNLSSNLLDIELLEVPIKQQALLNAMFGTATRIDDLLFNLSNNIKKHYSNCKYQ